MAYSNHRQMLDLPDLCDLICIPFVFVAPINLIIVCWFHLHNSIRYHGAPAIANCVLSLNGQRPDSISMLSKFYQMAESEFCFNDSVEWQCEVLVCDLIIISSAVSTRCQPQATPLCLSAEEPWKSKDLTIWLLYFNMRRKKHFLSEHCNTWAHFAGFWVFMCTVLNSANVSCVYSDTLWHDTLNVLFCWLKMRFILTSPTLWPILVWHAF